MTPSAPLVGIVTAVWNQLDVTLEFLASVRKLEYPNIRMFVVDNGSQEQVVEPIQAAYPGVHMTQLPQNLGFSGGFNRGIEQALAAGCDYVLVINNDTILEPSSLSKLVAKAQVVAQPGLITPKIYYLEEPDRIWHFGGQMNNLLLEVTEDGVNQTDVGQFDHWDTVDFAPLCVALIPAEALRDVGLFDEEFFLFYEDMDFSLRLRQAGYSLHLVPDAHVWHAVSTSSGGQYAPLERYWMAQGSGRYFRKHGRPLQLIFVILPYRLASGIKMTLRLLRLGKPKALRAYWLGNWRGWTTGKAVTQPPEWVK